MRRSWHPLGRVIASAATAAILSVGLAGCADQPKDSDKAILRNVPPPTYAALTSKYNERVAKFDRIWARSVVRLKYVDEKGQDKQDQGEGLLQVVRPDKMGLSIKKAGAMLFWFGCDETHYWLFDVVDRPVVRVGKHELAGVPRGKGGADAGLQIKPLELIRLLGIVPLPVSAKGGATLWSKDGRYVEVVTPINATSSQRMSIVPETFEPARIDILDAKGVAVLQATLEDYEQVDIENAGWPRPRIAKKITAVHPQSKTQIILDLSDMKNSGTSDKAFKFEELCKALGVDRMIDLDKDIKVPPPVKSPPKAVTPTPPPLKRNTP